MEFWFSVFAILCICTSLYSLRNLFQSNDKKRLPPSPPTIPILGNFLWLVKSSRNFSSVEPILRQLRTRYGPIVTLHIGSRPSIFITTREAAHHALVQCGSVFADRPSALETSRVFFSNQHTVSTASYGPLWRLLRHNFMSLTNPSRLHLYCDRRKWALDILNNKLMAEAESGKAIDVIDHVQHSMFCLMIHLCYGDKYEEDVIEEIEALQRVFVKNFIRFNLLNLMPKLGKIVFRKLWKEVLELRRKQENLLLPLIIKARQKKNTDDDDGNRGNVSYIDSLLDLEIPGGGRKFSDGELVSLCSEFINSGTDTSITTLQWVMANVVKHQHIQEKLLKEINSVVKPGEEIQDEDLKRMPYLKAVILETLRRHPPGHFVLPHAVVEDTKLDGYDIPKNAIVNFPVAELSRDPKVWEDPMEFKPERFLQGGDDMEEAVVEFDLKGIKQIRMIPFGAGRRACPAISMAILHQEYYVANLIRDFKWAPETSCEDIDLSEKQDFTVVLQNPLRVHISPRTQQSIDNSN